MTEQTTETESGTLPGTGEVWETTGKGAKEVPTHPAAHAAPEQNEPATFPRKVVEDLRRENAKHRTRAQRADDLATRLHVALVTATGRLADASDLAFDDAHLDDPEALTAAIEDLITRKPHLASRRVVGDVGQGATQGDPAVDLAGMLRRNAH